MFDQKYNFSFGYPEIASCTTCTLNPACQNEKFALKTGPYYKDSPNSEKRLMLIGQDPTIRKKRDRVTHVLMLDRGGSIYRWLKDLFGEKFDNIDIYATNVVKCTFKGDLPTERKEIDAVSFLKNYFEQCKEYLIKEIIAYRPDYIISFGQPAHTLLADYLFKSEPKIPSKMTTAFTGQFYNGYIENEDIKTHFKYSPCLHITTFRVADTYGKKVKDFKEQLRNNL